MNLDMLNDRVLRSSKDDAGEYEWQVLSTENGRNLLSQIGQVMKPSAIDMKRWRKQASFDVVSAALRIVQTRRNAAAKFSRAPSMWLDPLGLEQSTAEAVAIHKSRRFEGSLAVDLCCGIGGDAIAIARASSGILTVDRDHAMLRRAFWNANAYECADRMLFVQSRAETMAIPSQALIHIDPDRRAKTASRAKKLEGYAPGIPFLKSLTQTNRGGAIKLGPASDFEEHFGGDGFEIELVSLNGECKEATVWFGDRTTCRRRATALPSGETWTDRDGRGRPGFGPLQEMIFEPDPALIRSGLFDSYAAAHQLSRFADGIDLLTGSIPSPMTTAFHVETVLPLDVKTIRRELARRCVGRLEIKTRGVEMRPEEFRKTLKLDGPNEATLILVGGSGGRQAIFVKRGPAC